MVEAVLHIVFEHILYRRFVYANTEFAVSYSDVKFEPCENIF